MQSLIAVGVVSAILYLIYLAKNYGKNLIAFTRVFVKRAALYMMSFSWIIVIAAVLMLACYSGLSGLLKDILSVNSVDSIKGLVRLIFGVDSAFVALQTVALYSLMLSFVSCLCLSVGLVVRFVHGIFLKTIGKTLNENEKRQKFSALHITPTFKLYLKYNS